MNLISRPTIAGDSARPMRQAPRVALALFALAAAFHLFSVFQGLTNSLEGPHDFRQAQTALATYNYARHGVALDYETPVFGYPTSIPFEFPTYQLLVYGFWTATDLPLEVCGRVVSIGLFYVALAAMALTLRRLRLPSSALLLGLAAVLLCPVYIFYTRAFLIESTALACSWWFLLAAVAASATPPARRARLIGWTVLCVTAGILAAVTKITTFAIYAAAAAFLWLATQTLAEDARLRTWRRWPWRGFAQLVAVTALALIIAVAWTRHVDAVKLRNPSPFAAALTSPRLHDWTFGPPGMLFRVATWRTLFERGSAACFGSFVGAAGLALLLPFVPAHRRQIIALLAAFVLGPLVFTNLYAVHDYYWYANSALYMTATGVVLGLIAVGEASANPRWIRWLPPTLFVVAQAVSYHFSEFHFVQRVPPHTVVDAAEAIRKDTLPESSLLVFGFDWNPLLPFYAERPALMIPWSDDHYFNPGSQAALAKMTAAGHPVGAVIFGGAKAHDEALQRRVLATLAGGFSRTVLNGDTIAFFRVSPLDRGTRAPELNSVP